MPVGDTLLEALPRAPFDIVADGAAFLLCKRSEQRHQQLALCSHGVDVFLFEPNGDAQLLQASDGHQHVQRIAGEAGDALGENQVDVPGFTFSHQALELGALSAGAADAGVGENACVLPAGIALDQLIVAADLR